MSPTMRTVFGLVGRSLELASFLALGLAACTLSPDLSMSGQPCGSLTCEKSGATLTATLTVTAAEVPGLTVEVCRNDVCAHTAPTPDSDDASFTCDVFGPLSTSCQIISNGTTAQLELTFTGRGSDFVDGDHYVVNVTLSSGASIFSVDEQVSYDETRPNGPACDPLCRFATL